jgi:O-antigen/teichoic acid export membrane protein
LGHRGRQILHTATWSLVAKLASAANLFIAVPFVLRDLGPGEFGAWATLVSVVYFAGFLDFGFGNGTMNLIAAAHGRGAVDEIPIILREGYRTLTRVALALTMAILVVLPWIPWHRLLGLPEDMARKCLFASAAVLLSIAAAVPLNLANRVHLALGRGERAFRWQAGGQMLSLGVVVVLTLTNASLPLLTLAAVGTPLLTSIGNTLSLRKDPALRVANDSPRSDIAERIRREGFLFFVMQLAAALAFSADLPLISALRDPVQAGVYAIAQRLFSIIPLGLSLVWAPLWPVYRHALAAGHHDWVKRTLWRSVVVALCVAGAAGVVIVLGFNRITTLWLHHSLIMPPVLLVGFAIWSVMEAGGTALATFLNAASVMRFQLACTTAFALLCFSGKIWAITGPGMEWLPWVTAITWGLTTLLPFIGFRKRILAEAFGRKY